MPTSSELIAELLDLADRLCDGGLTPGEALRLNQLLRESDQLRQCFLAHRELHASLAWHGRGGRITGSLFDKLVPQSPSVAKPLPFHFGRRATRAAIASMDVWRTRPATAWLSTAAAVALMLGLAWLAWPTVPVAQVVRTCDAVWGADSDLLAGAELQADKRHRTVSLLAGQQLHLMRGAAEIRFRSGATVLLEGPATLAISDANLARLDQGKLVAQVPPAANGFQVITPEATVVDLGTEFALFVQRPSKASGRKASTELHVLTGRVEIAPQLAARSTTPRETRQPVVAGEAVRVDAGATTFVKIEAQPQNFVRTLPELFVIAENFEALHPGSPPIHSRFRRLYERKSAGREQSIRVVEPSDLGSARFGRHTLEIRDNDPDRKMANPVIDFLLPPSLAKQAIRVQFDFRVLDAESLPLFTINNRDRYVLLHPEVTLEGSRLGIVEPGKWYRATVEMPAVSSEPATSSMLIERFENGKFYDPMEVTVTSVHSLPGNAVRFGFHSPSVKPAGGRWQIDNVEIRAYAKREKLR